jgi:serine/threonine-protein kinase HipA
MTPDGDWSLAPAYDLTYSPGPGGEHYMDIAGEGRRPARSHVIALGEQHGFSAKQISAMIDEARTAVADWTRFAAAAGVTTASAKAIGDAHVKVWADFAPR